MNAPDSASPGPDLDLLIVGGGINGVGIARDAAGRGLKVLLVERDDLAGHTSSASTKLIHGGLRYLEYGEIRLVRESLIERERLWGMAPHIIWPLRFVLPQTNSPRPGWMVRLGLLVYDHLGGRKRLPATQTITLARSPMGEGLVDRSGKAFAYSDCWVEDSRLVVLNARDAADRGAQIETRTRLIAARRGDAGWTADIEGTRGRREIRARALVNAAGPWVTEVLRLAGAVPSDSNVRLVKGSHIVVPRLFEGDHAFMLQNPDRRIVFAIPYEGKFTLLGTTEVAWEGAPATPTINADETEYLIATANRYFLRQMTVRDIVWTYSGIRPLHEDHAANASAVTRDYALDLVAGEGAAPMLSVFGGKITTYRKLAEHALAELSSVLSRIGPAWTAGAPLPGGDMEDGDFERFERALAARRRDFPRDFLQRLARAYGTLAESVLGEANSMDDMGEDFGGGLTKREVDYLVAHEWARTAQDILFRRGKLGLHVPAGTAERLSDYLGA